MLPSAPESCCACNDTPDIKNSFFAKKGNTYIVAKDVCNNSEDLKKEGTKKGGSDNGMEFIEAEDSERRKNPMR